MSLGVPPRLWPLVATRSAFSFARQGAFEESSFPIRARRSRSTSLTETLAIASSTSRWTLTGTCACPQRPTPPRRPPTSRRPADRGLRWRSQRGGQGPAGGGRFPGGSGRRAPAAVSTGYARRRFDVRRDRKEIVANARPIGVKVKNRQHPAMERVMEAMSWASRSSPGTDRPAAHHRA